MINYKELGDAELVAILRKGDPVAFTTIYDRYFWHLHAHACKWLSNPEEAKDIIHELFIKLWEKPAELNLKHTLGTYLYASVRNRVYNALSHKYVETSYLDSLKYFSGRNECITDHLIREKQLAEIIETGIAAMPAKMREVFILSRRRYLNHRQIAEKLNISEQTVRKHIQHALRILRFRLDFLLPHDARSTVSL